MGITTKKGDSGYTSLFSGERVKKSSIYMETLGTLDELNSHLGLVKTKCPENIKKEIENIQTNIFSIDFSPCHLAYNCNNNKQRDKFPRNA